MVYPVSLLTNSIVSMVPNKSEEKKPKWVPSEKAPSTTLIIPPLTPHEISSADPILMARLTNPDLDPQDLKLVQAYREKGREIWPEIKQRLINLCILDLRTYDGKRDTKFSNINRRLEAFCWALDSVLDFKVPDRELAEVFLKAWLTEEGIKRLNRVLPDQDSVLEAIVHHYHLWEVAPFGSQEKIAAYQDYRILVDYAVARRRISYEKIDSHLLAPNFSDTKLIDFETLKQNLVLFFNHKVFARKKR